MAERRVIIVGAGIGGLVAAVELARRGIDVLVLERAARPGGKMREVSVGGQLIDAGPTVLTMRPVFDCIFADAGTTLDAHLALRRATIVARHAWSESERLDLFADRDRSADAIGHFAGRREAEGYRALAERARRIYESLDTTFMQVQRPRLDQLVSSFGFSGLNRLRNISPFATLWSALGEHFRDPRLLQLFGRYATYCGSSPFRAPATLMLVSHTEQDGVWYVEGGMYRLAEALTALAVHHGATVRTNSDVRTITVSGGRATGVVLASGEQLQADAVVANVDSGALAAGFLGKNVAGAAPPCKPTQRSLSAVTVTCTGETAGFPLIRHNVFFSRDYSAEFEDLRAGRLPREPTVYVCAQDRADDGADPTGPERLLCLANAPATGDTRPFSAEEIQGCEDRSFALLARCGLRVERTASVTTDPAGFERLFPGTGGALYGPASHGWQASFSRAGSRGLPGLYLAGGSVHPGPGVPMAAISGRLSATAIVDDWASTGRSRWTATPGGTSTRSAPTVPMP